MHRNTNKSEINKVQVLWTKYWWLGNLKTSVSEAPFANPKFYEINEIYKIKKFNGSFGPKRCWLGSHDQDANPSRVYLENTFWGKHFVFCFLEVLFISIISFKHHILNNNINIIIL